MRWNKVEYRIVRNIRPEKQDVERQQWQTTRVYWRKRDERRFIGHIFQTIFLMFRMAIKINFTNKNI